jgi:hypothetical protein
LHWGLDSTFSIINVVGKEEWQQRRVCDACSTHGRSFLIFDDRENRSHGQDTTRLTAILEHYRLFELMRHCHVIFI